MTADSDSPACEDREIRIMEIKAGVKKVVYGTAIVGVAAAFFPFAQETSRAWFEFLTTERAERVAQRNGDRNFLESLKDEGRSKNLEDRIVLAEFYATVSPEVETRQRWQAFLEMLTEQRAALRQADIEAIKNRMPDASAEETAAAVSEAMVRQLRESADAGTSDGNLGPRTFGNLVQQLESTDTATRRKARDELSKFGTALVRPAMAELLTPEATYRLRLGLVVALTEMLRDNKRLRSDIIPMIDDAALTEMLRLAADNEDTIRIYAGEFLYDLGDPRVYALASAVWNSGVSDNGKFNLALALKGAAPFVAAADKPQAANLAQSWIGQVGPRTDELLREALQLLGRT